VQAALGGGVEPKRSYPLAARVDAIASALRGCIESAPDDLPGIVKSRLEKALRTLERDEVQIAVAGLFKAGKSTFINRLAKWDILPTGGLPETGAPGILRRRKPGGVRVKRRSGEILEISPDQAEVSKHTSLYDKDGRRRHNGEIADWVEIDAPRLSLPRHVSLIDLPGLRDTADMDEVALEMALEADVILWVFRSEPAFSEQDTSFLQFLISVCGAHVLQLVLNVFTPDEERRRWRSFFERSLPTHHSALSRVAPALGLESEAVDRLLVVDAKRFRRRLFGTDFGAREVRRFLRQVARRGSDSVKRARFFRVGTAAEFAAAWLSAPLEDAAAQYREQDALYRAYEARLVHRKALTEKLDAALTDAFKGLEAEFKQAGHDAARKVELMAFRTGENVAKGLIEQSALIIRDRALRLAVACQAISSDTECIPLSAASSEVIERSFSLFHSGEDIRERIYDGIARNVGEVRLEKPKLSLSRIGSWIQGGDNEVAASKRRAQSELNRRAANLAGLMNQRKTEVAKILRQVIQLIQIEHIDRPSPVRWESLKEFERRLDRLQEALSG
jgi:hypothetical protein